MHNNTVLNESFFYLLDYISLSRISKCGIGKNKIKIKTELEPILNYRKLGGIIYVNDMYSKKGAFPNESMAENVVQLIKKEKPQI